MNNIILQDGFRKQLTNTHALTVLTISLIEIISYIVFINRGFESWSIENEYLRNKVILPIIINLAAHLAARWVVNNDNIHRKNKNAAIIAAALITSLVVSIAHRQYIATGCAFVFPMVLSAMFNDRKLLNMSFVSSVGILLCMCTALMHDDAVDLTTAINLLVLFGFVIVAFFCGRISINFSGENYSTIESQAEANIKLREHVLRDQMTGLYNHKSFYQFLADSITFAEAHDRLCLAMIDVDNFKKVNDTYGHDSGDEVLIYLADVIKQHCSDDMIACRYGGEEFAVIFRNDTIGESCSIIESMLEDFRNHRFSFTDAPITFSSGVALYSAEMDKNEFFALADQTLYAAKHGGKNQVKKSLN